MKGYVGRGVHGSTVELLGARIVAGHFQPGEILELRGLGEELDVSHTALREALKVLMAKGLLDARQRRGTFVRPRADWDALDSDVIRWRAVAGESEGVLRDLGEVRAVIEPAAGSLAATRRTDEDLAELDEALEEMRRAVGTTPDRQASADLRFHAALLYATHNEMFARMEVFVEPALLLRDSLVHEHDVEDPVPSHRAVLDAVRAGDADTAEEAVRALLAQASADLMRILAEDEPEPDTDKERP